MDGEMMKNNENIVSAGISFGSALAMILSYSVNGSILWAMIHGMLGWLYVVWAAIR